MIGLMWKIKALNVENGQLRYKAQFEGLFRTHSYKPLGIWDHPQNWWNEQACPLINTLLF